MVASALGALNTETAEILREGFQQVMKLVADVANREAGAVADLFVFEILLVFELQEGAILLWQLGQEQPDGPGCFLAGELPVRGVIFVLSVGRFFIGLPAMIAEVIESQIADRTIEPRPGMRDILPVGVEPEKGLLDEVFRSLPPAGQAVGKAQQRAFLGLEDLAESRFLRVFFDKRKDLRHFNPGLWDGDFHAVRFAESWLS